MRFVRDVLIALVTGLVIALITVAASPRDLERVLVFSIIGTTLALALVLWMDWKRAWIGKHLRKLASHSPLTWCGWRAKRGRTLPDMGSGTILRVPTRSDDATTHQLTFFTTNEEARHISTEGRPRALVFTSPLTRRVNADDLPAEIPCDGGKLILKRFTADGFAFEEKDTRGVQVEAEVYFDEGSPGYKARVVTELIERGAKLRTLLDGSNDPSGASYVYWQVGQWMTECWSRLGQAVTEWRGLFDAQALGPSEPEVRVQELRDYLDARLCELRKILERVS